MRRIGLLPLALVAVPTLAAAPGDWPTFGRDKGGQRHSPLTQITPANVSQLQQAWVYHMKPADTVAVVDTATARARADEGAAPLPSKPKFLQSQMTPLVVDGRMFISTPYGRAVALNPVTGKELWATSIGANASPSIRGVEYWAGDAKSPARIVFGTTDGRLIELDAKTGAFVQSFGDHGAVNLRTAEIMNGFPNAQYHLTSPVLIVGDLIVTGARVQENPIQGASGDVRAWDVRTGKLIWTFHTIPRPGEPNYGTWAPGSDVKRSGVNVWGFMTADIARGIVYLPVAGATYDRYGGDRTGDDLYGSSLVAVDARTGKYLWHFQLQHHDIWDNDAQSAPVLFDAKIGGRTIPAVAVTNKAGLMFMFNRVTGKPLHPIIEKPFPASDVPGEIASKTQPIPSTPPLARTGFKYPDDLVDVSPDLRAWCDNWFKTDKMTGTTQFEPYHADHPAVHYPSTEGGPSWGGETFDPKTGNLIVAVNNLGFVTQLIKQSGPVAYATKNAYFREPKSRDLCVKPPWASLVAVNTTTGDIAWSVPLGVTDHLPEAVRNTGRVGHGGAITTDSGLIFIGFSDDERFRAFDARNGKELWVTRLEASAHATPVTYQGKDGRQYVAINSTGGTYVGTPITSDTLTAFALPKR